MKTVLSVALYLALAAGAIAGPDDIAGLRTGDMKKLNIHTTAKPSSDAAFMDATGAEMRLSDLRGKTLLVNFWATWCAPCRKEMPALSALQEAQGGDGFAVITIATGRNDPAAMEKFMADAGISNLPLYRDPKMAVAREMGVLGLPVTVILDPDGNEIARLQGDADWNSDSARAIIDALSVQSQPPKAD